MTTESGDLSKIVEAVHNDPETKARFNIEMAIAQSSRGSENFSATMAILISNLRELEQNGFANRAQNILDSYNNPSSPSSESLNNLKDDIKRWLAQFKI